MPTTCKNCNHPLHRQTFRDDPDVLRIEYEATMAAMEALLHHYRILALRLELLVADAESPLRKMPSETA